MRKRTIKPLRLASNGDTWREMGDKIEHSVSQVCQHYDAETTESFLFLVDLLTNPDYDAQDRDLASDLTLRAAFRFTPEFDQAREEYLNRINPGRAQLAKVS